MNGDGYDDILIGAKDADATAANNAGESYVVFGGEYGVKGWTDTNSSLNLDTLDGDNGFRLDGISSGDQSGISVSSAGDVNGDGLDDILIGATGNDAGESYIIFGEALMGSVSHETLTGDSNANTMVGGLGNDILLGQGGADVLYGGSGNDILTVTDNTFFKLKGGSGIDTLKLADGLDLDLTTIANNKVQGIEKIDMTNGDTTNSLTLNLSDVLNLSDSTNTLIIDGDRDGTSGGSDKVTVSDGTWIYKGESNDYHEYSLGEAILLIGINIHTDLNISTG